MMSATGDPEN